MVRLRTKYWYMLTGTGVLLTFIFAMNGNLLFTGGGFLLSMFDWYMAEHCLEQDAEELMKKIEGKE